MNEKDICILRGSSSALHIKDNFVSSILCGAHTHNDFIENNLIVYVVPNRPYYKKSIISLLNNSIHKQPIQVFEKENINQWIDKGFFKISSITEESNEVNVKLILITNSKGS
jgi:hypothetical protein